MISTEPPVPVKQRTYSGCIDPKARENIQGLQSPGEPDLYLVLLDVFFKSSEESLADLFHCIKNANLDRVKDIAHSWKSSAFSIGAIGLGELCADLESLADGKDTEKTNLILAIQDEYSKVKAELKNHTSN